MDDFNLIRVSNEGEISIHESDLSSSHTSVEVELGSTSDSDSKVEEEETHVDDTQVETVNHESFLFKFQNRVKHLRNKALIISNGCWGLLCIILLIALA
jgi:hypothetical protein